MVYQIKVSKDAEKDILTAKCHYRISGLEQDFDYDLKKQIDFLRTNPFLFQIYYRNIRRVLFDDFKYSIHFFVQGETIYILRILHHKQKFK